MSERTSVFIVGGGPVGLSLALLLDRHGVDSVLVERNATTATFPKARTIIVRSMEMFRQLGIESDIRARARSNDKSMAFVESVAGHVFGAIRPESPTARTPAQKCSVDQSWVEEVLYAAARRCSHAAVHFATEFLSFETDDDGVRVRTKSLETGEEREWSAQYLIGADGGSSRVRELLGIDMTGPALTTSASQYWRADLSHIPATRHRSGFYIHSSDPAVPRSTSVIRDDGENQWMSIFHVGIGDSRERPWSDDDMIKIIRAQVGDPDIDVELRGYQTWRVHNRLAGTYRRDRVFLVGDAAHLMPFTGGFGLNTGFQDAHNLAWKLAFVLQGHANERLLETYEAERRPIAQSNANWSLGNAPRFGMARAKSGVSLISEALNSRDPDRIAFWLRDLENQFWTVGRALGFVYNEGAVIPDGTVAPEFSTRVYTPTDRPGARFPHVWVDLAGDQSTLDWFDRDFTLVTGPMGGEWLEAGQKVSEQLNMPLALRSLPQAYPDDGIEIGLRGAALVRPDGHVAWRRPWLRSADPVTDVTEALSTLLK